MLTCSFSVGTCATRMIQKALKGGHCFGQLLLFLGFFKFFKSKTLRDVCGPMKFASLIYFGLKPIQTPHTKSNTKPRPAQRRLFAASMGQSKEDLFSEHRSE